MQESAMHGMQDAYRTIYNRAGRPCPRCGTLLERRGQGDDNRTTTWCPGCQT
jgi:endonuclease-8